MTTSGPGTVQSNARIKVLLLGGISEAKKLAQQLHNNGISLVYSIQGSVRGFNADYEVTSGGFSQYCISESSKNNSVSGLNVYLEKNRITLIVDVTHPYADVISVNAQESAKLTNIPYLRYTRPPWSIEKLAASPFSLQVQELASYEEILAKTHTFKRLFWAVGYNSLAKLECHHPSNQQWIFRAAKKPTTEYLERTEQGVAHLDFIEQIGPFTLQDETKLFQQKQIDALICKNSGGNFNEAKLKAASALDIPVFLLKRPNKIAANRQYSSIETLFNAIIARI